MDQELIIKLGLDPSHARQQANAFVDVAKADVKRTVDAHAAGEQQKTAATTQGARQRAAAADAAGKAETDAGRRVLTSAEAAEQAKRQLIDQTNRKRVQAAMEAIAASHKEAAAIKGVGGSFTAVGAAAEGAGKSGAAGFLQMAASMGAGQIAAQKLMESVQALGQALEASLAKRKEFANLFTDARDQMGELAMLMGEKPDDAFTQKIAQYGKDSLQTPQESRELLTEMYNSGAQYKGRNISNKEFDQYGVQLGQFAGAKGLERAQVGDLGGSVLGFQDFSKFGDQASEQALGKVNSAVGILGAGKGRNSVLMNQFNMTASASLNEDALKGTFQSSDEVAAAVSIMASKHDAQASELVKMAGRALRGFDKDQGALLKKVGIDAKTSFIDAIKKLAPEVEAQAKAQGIKTEDVLRQNFKDEGAIDALNVAINEGVFKGGFDHRAAFGKALQGPKPALESIEEFKASDRGAKRLADADRFKAKLELGQQQAPTELLRQQAETQLIRDKQIDTTETNFADTMKKVLTLGMGGDFRQRRIDNKAQEMLKDRAGPGVKLPGGFQVNADVAEQDIRGQMDAINKAGGQPFIDAGRLRLPPMGVAPARPVGPQAQLELPPGVRDQLAAAGVGDARSLLMGQAGGVAPMGFRGALAASMMGALPGEGRDGREGADGTRGARGPAAGEDRTVALLERIAGALDRANEQRGKLAPPKNPPIVGRPQVMTR